MPAVSALVKQLYGVDAEMANEAQLAYYNLTSVDAGPTDTGATALGTTQSNAYQIIASNTIFSTVAAGTGAALPETSAAPGGLAQGLRGLSITIVNVGANYLTVYPSVNDVGATINGVSSVVLQPLSITPFYCGVPGVWTADGIGAGYAGSIETVASQGNVAAAGSTQGTAAAITQALAQVTGTSGGVILPNAQAGLEITLNFTGASGSVNVYPASGQSINALSANTAFAQALPSTIPVIFFCFVSGTWATK